MPLQRFYCMNCGESVYNKKVGTRRIPLVITMVLGQPEDTGERLNVMDKDVKVPSFVRELFNPGVPVARWELCIPCVAEVFGLKMYTPDEDPMHSKEQATETMRALQAIHPATDGAEKQVAIMRRALLAVKVGRGALKAPKLPKALPEAEPVRTLKASLTQQPPGAARRARKRAATPVMKHVEPPAANPPIAGNEVTG